MTTFDAQFRLGLLLSDIAHRQASTGATVGLVSDGATARPPEEAERFRELYDVTYRRLLAYARRRTDDVADADEVVAETYLVAWRRLQDVPAEDEQAMAWLYGVARRVLSTVRRGRERRGRLVRRLSGFTGVPRGPHPEDRAVGSDEAARVRAALGRLPSRDREILQLAAWEGLPQAEIAVALNISVTAVESRLHRARRRLADGLADV